MSNGSQLSQYSNPSYVSKRINGMTPVPNQKQLQDSSDDEDMFMQLNEDNNVPGDRSS